MKNFKLTSQRMAILEFLRDNKTHPSAEDIYKSVKEKTPHVSLATVYNTLEMLERLGLISELTIKSKKRRYDPNTLLHHHFMCLKCNRVIDINETININMVEQISNSFTIVNYEIDLYGYCDKCNKNET